MEIKVPLAHFVNYLTETKEKHRNWPQLDEIGFLLDNFSFDDNEAAYSPKPNSWAHYTDFMRQLARN